MTQPRHSLISLDYTPYYHIISRCVRRAFLCGRDQYAKKNYNHRRQWIKDRIHALQDVFCIDIAAYAIMNNHYHLVIHINKNKEQLLADGDVVKRWSRLFKIPTFIMKELDKGQTLSLRAQILVNIWRKRLVSASWFIKTLNEYIAKKANKEDDCTGRFWEGRFKSQALLDEKALMMCMAYVDLNPLRASMSTSIQSSDHTSAQARHVRSAQINLMHFSDQLGEKDKLPFSQKVYSELLKESQKLILNKKTDLVDIKPFSISLNNKEFKQLILSFETTFSHFAGSKTLLERIKNKLGMKRLKGLCFVSQYSTSLDIGSALV
tara:strand:+ start:3555 stop:4517 length:963 start_codon:yes stop_codon:yes gene_type:complete